MIRPSAQVGDESKPLVGVSALRSLQCFDTDVSGTVFRPS